MGWDQEWNAVFVPCMLVHRPPLESRLYTWTKAYSCQADTDRTRREIARQQAQRRRMMDNLSDTEVCMTAVLAGAVHLLSDSRHAANPDLFSTSYSSI